MRGKAMDTSAHSRPSLCAVAFAQWGNTEPDPVPCQSARAGSAVNQIGDMDMTRIPRVRVRDLKDQIGTFGPRPMLYCYRCGAEYSANSGDYFLASPDHVFKCECHSKSYLRLVLKETQYIPA